MSQTTTEYIRLLFVFQFCDYSITVDILFVCIASMRKPSISYITLSRPSVLFLSSQHTCNCMDSSMMIYIQCTLLFDSFIFVVVVVTVVCLSVSELLVQAAIPAPSFQFGGSSGQTVSTVVFQKP